MSVEQVKNSLRLQRLKLYSKFDGAVLLHSERDCCSLEISEDDLHHLDQSIASYEEASEDENAALFYVAGYIQHKYQPVHQSSACGSCSEFTELVSRGRLSFPSEPLFQFIRIAYCAFNQFPNVQPRFQCVTYIAKLFTFLYNSLPLEIDLPLHDALKTLINCFFKGFTKLETSCYDSSSASGRKLRKLCDSR